MTSSSGSRVIKNSLYSLFNSIFMMVTSWIISIWVARQLGPERYGIFSLVLWLIGSITWIIGMGFIHAITKFISEFHGKGDTRSFTPLIVYVMKIEVVITICTTTLLILFKSSIADYFFTPNESHLFLIAALGLIPGIITALFSAAIEGIQEFKYFTYSNLIISPLSFIAKALILFMGKGPAGLLTVMVVFSFVNCLFYFIVLRKEGFFASSDNGIRLSSTIKEKILQYNKSVISILLCDKIVWDKSENFFLGRLCSSHEIGFYNLGFNVAQRCMSFLPSTLWRVLFPAMSSYFGSDSKEKMKRLFFLSTRYMAFFTFPIGIAGIILSYYIIHYLYGHEYINAQNVLQIIFASSILSTLSNPASAVLYGFNKQAFIFKFGAILSLFNILLDFFLIKNFGAIGAAFCYGITTAIASVGGLYYTCKTMHLSYPLVSVSKIFFATIIMAIAMEIIIIQNNELSGFILSIFVGCFVYIISSLVLGTFEEEDYDLLTTIEHMSPGKFKYIVASIRNILGNFKNRY